ncbi:hypothetical protein GGF46_002977 [Coemansia sp. RSA 552]|nr:hypothetical protein GGF46_002977 [Coemansia sp. RSA 552]
MGDRGAAASSVPPAPYQNFSPVGAMSMMGYSSYASLLNKATLMFDNNLDSMAVEWTLEERECRRRLVQFWRRHESSNIFCTFKAVAAADRVPNSIVVSCIYWEERRDFFITSVDCIHLLESLIAVRFTVEEKNRIRRNLEGFRPLTVSKYKAESAGFFKLIMSFPNPKPRNIEKDVKVFPWRILPLALKKIIGKYTASYSSTSGAAVDTRLGLRRSGDSQLAGATLSAPAGGMMSFSPHTSAPDILGSSPASMSAATAATASSRAVREKPASVLSPGLVASAPTTSYSEAQATSPEQPIAGMCLGLDMVTPKSDAASVLAPSSALDCSAAPDFGNLAASLTGIATSIGGTVVPTCLQSSSHKSLGNEHGQGHYLPDSVLTPEHSTHLGGMAVDESIALLAGGTSDEQSASIFEQLAASCGFPGLSYGLPSVTATADSDSAGVGSGTRHRLQQRQHVVRGSVARRSVQHAPYAVARNKAGCSSSERGAEDVPLGTPSRVGTSLSSTCDRSGEREASLSVPLVLAQQQQTSEPKHADGSAPEMPMDTGPCDGKSAPAPFYDDLTFLTDFIRETEAVGAPVSSASGPAPTSSSSSSPPASQLLLPNGGTLHGLASPPALGDMLFGSEGVGLQTSERDAHRPLFLL